MTNSLPWKITIFKNGKPSISMGHGFHGYVSRNQRVLNLEGTSEIGNSQQCEDE